MEVFGLELFISILIFIVESECESYEEVQGRNVEEALDNHDPSSTNVPSISEPIFKLQKSSQDQAIMFRATQDRLQNCIIDENGKYQNEGGKCTEECFEKQTLVIYDWNEGFCCCAYIEKTHKGVSTCDDLIELKLQENTETFKKLILKAFPKFVDTIFTFVNTSKIIENCIKDENGQYLNLDGSCKGKCSEGSVAIIYDSDGGFCCCSDQHSLNYW